MLFVIQNDHGMNVDLRYHKGGTVCATEGDLFTRGGKIDFFDLLAERIGLFITLDNPNAIAWARNNMPVFVAFANHGAYIASTPLAFPDDAGEPQLLYSNSCGWLYADKLIQSPFKKVNIEVPKKLNDKQREALKGFADTLGEEVNNKKKGFWEKK